MEGTVKIAAAAAVQGRVLGGPALLGRGGRMREYYCGVLVVYHTWYVGGVFMFKQREAGV